MFEKIKGLFNKKWSDGVNRVDGYRNNATKQFLDDIVDDNVRTAVEYITGEKTAAQIIEEKLGDKVWDKAVDFIKDQGMKLKGVKWAKAKLAVKYGMKGVKIAAKVAVCAKAAAAIGAVVVIVGTGYYVYNQLTKEVVEIGNQVDAPFQIETPSPSPTPSEAPAAESSTPTPSDPDPIDPDPADPDPIDIALPGDGVISGTYIDDFSGSLIFTFTGDTVSMDFDGWVIEGTFSAENGVLYIDTSEPSMFSHRDIPFTVEGDGDAFTIDGGNRFARQ